MPLSYRKMASVGSIVFLIFWGLPLVAETCLAPTRPFVPSDPGAAKEYEDLIRQDFENYIGDIQDYFRCMESERARAFEEAQEVSQEYGRFVQQMAR
jgi:hypothetical protein